jgi:hypothetical protein
MGTGKIRTGMPCLRQILRATIVLLTAISLAAPAMAADDYVLTIKDHRFTPETLEIPADRKVRIVIRNLDATPEEFDSDELHREKVIAAGREAVIFIGPLGPGIYRFIGEFNPATAKGQVVVK